MLKEISPISWKNNKLILLDQRLLPSQEIYLELSNLDDVITAIKNLTVRGAPAIGVTAAFGFALAASNLAPSSQKNFCDEMKKVGQKLIAARPTAVNLLWAVKQMLNCLEKNKNSNQETLVDLLIKKAIELKEQDILTNKKIGEFGATLIQNNDVILTHCNAGALATAGFGTALGVLYTAIKQGKNINVFADETRPVLQGARLTSWELCENGVATTVITDNMAASFMQKGLIKKVIVGADRIAINGDVANKIGTYGLAVLAHYHKIPFYVAAPFSTFDKTCPSGDLIPIEQRNIEEVSYLNDKNKQICHPLAKIENPAFDVTPANLITAIITEKGILYPPF